MSVLDATAVARLRRLGGERLLREMIELFLQQGEARLQAAAGADRSEAERACHSLKSAAGNLGASALQRAAAAAEESAVRQDAAAHAAAVAEVQRTYAEAAAALRRLLEETSS